jgi:hypothetical protein
MASVPEDLRQLALLLAMVLAVQVEPRLAEVEVEVAQLEAREGGFHDQVSLVEMDVHAGVHLMLGPSERESDFVEFIGLSCHGQTLL